MNINDPKILVPSQNLGTIKTILPRSILQSEEVYTGLTKIVINRSAGVTTQFTTNTFIRDTIIQQINSSGEIIAKGIIVDWTVNPRDATKTSGTLLVNTTQGKFINSTNRNIYQYENGSFTNVQDSIMCEVTDSDIENGTGDIIYTKNIIKIGHGQDSIEEIKLVLGF